VSDRTNCIKQVLSEHLENADNCEHIDPTTAAAALAKQHSDFEVICEQHKDTLPSPAERVCFECSMQQEMLDRK
jgi:hypothetical protein